MKHFMPSRLRNERPGRTPYCWSVTLQAKPGIETVAVKGGFPSKPLDAGRCCTAAGSQILAQAVNACIIAGQGLTQRFNGHAGTAAGEGQAEC